MHRFVHCPLRFSSKLDLHYKLEAEKGKQISRVFLKGAEDDSKNMIERTVKLFEQSTGEYKCKSHLVHIVVSWKRIRCELWL